MANKTLIGTIIGTLAIAGAIYVINPGGEYGDGNHWTYAGYKTIAGRKMDTMLSQL